VSGTDTVAHDPCASAGHPSRYRLGGAHELGVQSCQRQRELLGEGQVACIVDGQALGAGNEQHGLFIRRMVIGDAKLDEAAQESGGVFPGRPAASLVDDDDVAHLIPP
jgi:hypothetical protein